MSTFRLFGLLGVVTAGRRFEGNLEAVKGQPGAESTERGEDECCGQSEQQRNDMGKKNIDHYPDT